MKIKIYQIDRDRDNGSYSFTNYEKVSFQTEAKSAGAEDTLGGIVSYVERDKATNQKSLVYGIGCHKDALLVLFFVVGVVKTCGSLTEVKKTEHALKLFIRFALGRCKGNTEGADR